MSHALLAATPTVPPPVAVSPVRVHGLGGYAAGCSCEICLVAVASLRVRITSDGLILRAYVTYHSALPAALAYWAVLGQFGWTVYTKRDGKTVTVARVDGTAAKARTTEQLRLLGMGWSAMSGKDSTRTDGDASKPRRTDLDQPDPGGSRDSATDR